MNKMIDKEELERFEILKEKFPHIFKINSLKTHKKNS